MPWGSVISIADGIHEKLDGLEWDRKDGDSHLKSLIQMNQEVLTVNGNRIRTALAIDQFITSPMSLQKRRDGTYSLIPVRQIATRWAYVYIASKYIVVDKKNHRDFVRDMIENKLKLKQSDIEYPVLDTKKIAAENKDQWVRGFAERKGRVNEGMLYGDGVEQDAVFGNELNHAKVKSVGITTLFFGQPTKVRISSNGVVSVLGNTTYEKFLEYVETEILPYRI